MEALAVEQTPPYGEIAFMDERFLCDHQGGLFWPAQNCLVVSDLHLEKGSAFASRGAMLPPYDTLATLQKLADCIARWQPETVISLGDSFHRPDSADNMPLSYRAKLQSLMQGRDWVWISGNHDPDAPEGLGGRCVDELSYGPIRFRHEQNRKNARGEISGHLHPKAAIQSQGKKLRRRCFLSDGNRLILPAFGAFTGGLNILGEAFTGLIDRDTSQIWMLGRNRVYEVSTTNLC